MRVIFLDHFGVVCLAQKHGRLTKWDELPRLDEMRIHGDFDPFSPGAVAVLNSILEKTHAEIVISSDWKRWATLSAMKEFYITQGVIKPPIEYTPFFDQLEHSQNYHADIKFHLQQMRSLEIQAWLKTHPDVTNWVCIDDLYLGEVSAKPHRTWGLENFVWVSRTDEGIQQKGIKEQLLTYLL